MNGNEAVPVQFTVSKDIPGTYNVDINGQQTRFTVLSESNRSSNDSHTILMSVLFGVIILLILALAGFIIKRLRQE